MCRPKPNGFQSIEMTHLEWLMTWRQQNPPVENFEIKRSSKITYSLCILHMNSYKNYILSRGCCTRIAETIPLSDPRSCGVILKHETKWICEICLAHGYVVPKPVWLLPTIFINDQFTTSCSSQAGRQVCDVFQPSRSARLRQHGVRRLTPEPPPLNIWRRSNRGKSQTLENSIQQISRKTRAISILKLSATTGNWFSSRPTKR